MSLVQQMPDRGPSPGLSINLNSNNPFRRTVSPSPASPVKIPQPASSSERHMSRNPFLDPPSGPPVSKSYDPATSRMADEIFAQKDASPTKPTPNGNAPARNPSQPRSGTLQPRPHDDRRGPRLTRPRPANGERSLLDSPDKSRPRRNSESSLMDKDKADEDRRRRERRRERERRDREGKTKDGKPKPTKKLHGLDVIDKLDVTGIYGQGLFHHDGPFDACNPHRNRRKDSRAPMHAFPENSANNALGGGAPKRLDLNQFHGRGEEGFADFASTGVDSNFEPQYKKREQASFDPTARVEPVHGSESHGLGTSTFLEGAPASRTAVQRRESEREEMPTQGNMGGLGRKKSLAMRIRGISQPRRPGEAANGRVTSPDGLGPASPLYSPGATMSAGGPLKARPIQGEKNPFFGNDHDDAYEKKGAQVKEAETGRPRSGSSPRGNGLTRSITADSGIPYGEPSESKAPSGPSGGFLNRMRSLKGGKRARPDKIGS